MARIFEPDSIKKHDDRLVMGTIQAKHIQEVYAECKIGIAINDGKFIDFVDDREVQNEN